MGRLLLIAGLFFIFVTPQSWAQQVTKYANPYRQTWWNNVTDSVHTMGQSGYQKKLTLMKLHNQRLHHRMSSISAAQKAKFKQRMASWQSSQNQ